MSKKELTGEEGVDYITCKICGRRFENLSSHLTRSHNMTKDKYLKLYPNSLLILSKLKLSMSYNTLKMWNNDDYRNYMTNHWQNYWKDEKNRSDQSMRTTEYNKSHPEKVEKHSSVMKEIWSDDDKRKKQSEILTKIWDDQIKRDKSSKDNIERLSKLTKEEIMILTFGMRNYWTPDRKAEHNQWQRDRWTPEMQSDKSKIRIQYFIDHPEAREEASRKTIEYFENNPETFIERGKQISAGHQGIPYEEWDHFLCDNDDWRDWSNVIYLNDRFPGCHRHHITETIVACILPELHNHISHNLKTGKGMAEMNMLALQFINGRYDD